MEALMNIKKLLFLPLLALSINAYTAYVPAPGPLSLADAINQMGSITATFINNQDLQNEAACIGQFAGQLPQNQRLYQNIIENISRAQSPQALLVLEAYGRVIMYMYQKEAYLLKASFLPHCFPLRGIKNPAPSQNELNQLLNEYDQLATIAMKKSYLVGSRMKLTVKSYKHWYWKTCTAIAAGAYLLYDIGQRNQKDTILYGLCRMNFKPILTNIKADLNIAASKTSSLKSSDAPKSQEDAIINQMLNLKASKDKLLEKEILAALNYRKAIEAQQLAVKSQRDVFVWSDKVNNQEADFQKNFNSPKEEAIITKETNLKLQTPPQNIGLSQTSIYEKMTAMPELIKTKGYNYFKTFVETYIDPASPNAFLR